MERIDLFDRYIKNELSDTEREKFTSRLATDEDFAYEFKIYTLTVDGICKEAHQDNLDFGIALKSISKAQLQDIIGRNNSHLNEVGGISTLSKQQKAPSFYIKPWLWQVASIAAVVILAFTAIFTIQRESRHSVDNAIYTCADFSLEIARSGNEVIDITNLTDSQLKAKLPYLEHLYNSSNDEMELADNGYTLVMAYLRLHNRNKAKEILAQLILKFENNEDFADSIAKWKGIFNLIK